MYSPLSQRFLHAVRNSGKLVIAADVYVDDVLIQLNAPVTDCDVTVDSSADIRRSASATVVNPNRQDTSGNIRSGGLTLPEGSTEVTIDLLNAEIQLKIGFEFENNEAELIPMGRFMVWESTQTYDQGDVYELELYDRAKYLQQTEILKFLDFSGVAAQTAIQDLLDYSLPNPQTVVFSVDVPNPILPGGSIYDNTVLQAVIEICDTLGAEFFFDLLGNPMVQIKPTISSSTLPADSVFTCNVHNQEAVDAGTQEAGNVITLGRRLTRENVYNGVGVYGAQPDENTDQPYGETFDLDPASRTYYNGPFGKAFKRMDRPELLTNAECLAAAQAELDRSISNSQPAEFEMLVNPALEPGDIITVIYPDETTELHLLDGYDVSAASASMSVRTRGRAISGA